MNWTVFPAHDSYNEASDYGVVELFINCQQRPVVYGDSAASAVPTWNVPNVSLFKLHTRGRLHL